MSTSNSIRKLTVLALVLFAAGCSDVPDEPYYQRSGAEPFVASADTTFADYLAFEETRLRRHRVFFDANDREIELERIAPFQLDPASHCPESPDKGVLLIHGLLDTAYGLKDIGKALADNCVLVRGILLPGHGTRPADLIDTHRQEWIGTVDFALAGLANEVDEVFALGFSLGGILALNAALDDSGIAGVVLIAPAVRVSYSWLAWQSLWFRHLSDWVDIDPHVNPVRYLSMPTNAIAQTYLLGGEVRRKLRDGADFPALTLVSAADLSIDVASVVSQMAGAFGDPTSSIIVFGEPPQSYTDHVRSISVFDEVEKIASFSHVALPFTPDNLVFGRQGIYRECGTHVGPVGAEEARACVANDLNWKGEFTITEAPNGEPLQRMTYNSRFDDMLDAILAFMSVK